MTRLGAHGRRAVPAVVGVVGLACLLLGCSAAKSGTTLGEQRSIARRVAGGGAECPLPVDSTGALRAAGLKGPVLPDQHPGAHASDGVIGSETPGSPLAGVDGVRLSCRFLVDGQRVSVVVVGVGKGHALSAALPDLAALGGLPKAQEAAFLTAAVDRRAGSASPVPGNGRAAVAPVRTADHSDLVVVVADEVLPLAPGSAGPPPPPLTQAALLRLASRLADDLAS